MWRELWRGFLCGFAIGMTLLIGLVVLGFVLRAW